MLANAAVDQCSRLDDQTACRLYARLTVFRSLPESGSPQSFRLNYRFMPLFSNFAPAGAWSWRGFIFCLKSGYRRVQMRYPRLAQSFDLHFRPDRYNPSNPTNGAARL